MSGMKDTLSKQASFAECKVTIRESAVSLTMPALDIDVDGISTVSTCANPV